MGGGCNERGEQEPRPFPPPRGDCEGGLFRAGRGELPLPDSPRAVPAPAARPRTVGLGVAFCCWRCCCC